MICKDCGQEEGYLSEVVKKKEIPFYCKICGALNFRLRATGDKAFVWPDPVEEKVGAIVIPDAFKDRHQSAYGTVISIGPGCVNKKKSCFIPTTVPVGAPVIYDIGVPWFQDEMGTDGKLYSIKIMGELDIKGIVCSADESMV